MDTDRLINDIFTIPIFTMIGGPIASLFPIAYNITTGVIDEKRKIANDGKIKTYHPKTQSEIQKEREEDAISIEEIEKLMVGSKVVPGIENASTDKYYQLTKGHDCISSYGYEPKGKIGVFLKGRAGVPVKEWPAEMYYRPTDFLNRMRKDIEKYGNVEMIKVKPTLYGHYMYTVNNGTSYVVCTHAFKNTERKEFQKI